jgi:hypothetical protein
VPVRRDDSVGKVGEPSYAGQQQQPAEHGPHAAGGHEKVRGG